MNAKAGWVRRVFCGLLLALALDARATTFSTDTTDLWWNANEAGWGINVIHQGENLFITFFVYSPTGAPLWFSASDVRFSSAAGGAINYTGQLFQSNGPWFGGNFDQGLVSYRNVGNVTFSLTTLTSATLTYTVDGVTVNKTLTRYTFRINNLNGGYVGATSGVRSNCTPISDNGRVDTILTMLVNQNNTTFSMQAVEQSGGSCNYNGVYSQAGKLGGVSGSYSCSNGHNGPFEIAELEANPNGFTGRFAYQYPGCTFTGRIVGVRPQ